MLAPIVKLSTARMSDGWGEWLWNIDRPGGGTHHGCGDQHSGAGMEVPDPACLHHFTGKLRLKLLKSYPKQFHLFGVYPAPESLSGILATKSI